MEKAENLHNVLIAYHDINHKLYHFFAQLNDDEFEISKEVNGCYMSCTDNDKLEKLKSRFFSEIISEKRGKPGKEVLALRFHEIDIPFKIPENTTLIVFRIVKS